MVSDDVWTADWSVIPKTVHELWRAIGLATFDLGVENRVVWRGLASTTFDLSSTLARKIQAEDGVVNEESIRSHEKRLLEEARNWDIGLSEHGRVSDLHLLAMLQHHGAPTRLIDVTYNPLTALWFACSDPKRMDEPGVLAVITVSDTPVRHTSEIPALTYDTLDNPEAATLVSLLRRSRELGKAVLVEPRPKDERMKAQEGAFITSIFPTQESSGPLLGLPTTQMSRLLPVAIRTLSIGNSVVNGQRWSGTNYAGIIIPPDLKSQLLPVLARTFNRSHRTMYPDLHGFVNALEAGASARRYEDIPDGESDREVPDI